MEKRKIIFDCDPGHDDIMAIMNALAHPEQLEILGYTTVCGNNYVDKVTRNLCQVLTALGKDGKVAVGYDAPLVHDRSACSADEHRGISEDLAGAEGKDRMYYAHGGKPQLGKYPSACRV